MLDTYLSTLRKFPAQMNKDLNTINETLQFLKVKLGSVFLLIITDK